METAVRVYEERDREACRALWRQLTQWHRDIYDDQSIWADRDPGDFFDEHLEHVGAERVWQPSPAVRSAREERAADQARHPTGRANAERVGEDRTQSAGDGEATTGRPG